MTNSQAQSLGVAICNQKAHPFSKEAAYLIRCHKRGYAIDQLVVSFGFNRKSIENIIENYENFGIESIENIKSRTVNLLRKT